MTSRESELQCRIIDLFAGPGGWDEGLRLLGHTDVLGIEWGDAACATREAAGHRTLQADVSELNPKDFPCRCLIASPPCQAWSMAGKGGGRADQRLIEWAIWSMAVEGADHRAELTAGLEDPRSILVVEPLRWALALRPEWIVLEQVPPVLPLWERIAGHLNVPAYGYSTWTGILEAERYGVPQTRERAFLIASRVQAVEPPRPTHQRYVPGVPAAESIELDGTVVQPWVSMAEALGWTAEIDTHTHTLVANRRRNTARRRASEPAPTITAGHDWAERRWCGPTIPTADASPTSAASKLRRRPSSPTPTGGPSAAGGVLMTNRDQRPDGTRQERPVSEPAPSLTAKSGGQWTWGRPATTVAADPRIAPPGWRGAPRDYDAAGNHIGSRQMDDAIRVTTEQALILQGFRPDYPVQGTKTKQFEQIGNAVPPPWAAAVLKQVIDSAD